MIFTSLHYTFRWFSLNFTTLLDDFQHTLFFIILLVYFLSYVSGFVYVLNFFHDYQYFFHLGNIFVSITLILSTQKEK